MVFLDGDLKKIGSGLKIEKNLESGKKSLLCRVVGP